MEVRIFSTVPSSDRFDIRVFPDKGYSMTESLHDTLIDRKRTSISPGLDIISSLVAALRTDDIEAAKTLIGVLHPADVADLLEQLPHDLFAQTIIRMEPVLLPETIAEFSDKVLSEALENLSDDFLVDALETLDSGVGNPLLEALPEARCAKILSRIDTEDRAALEDALSFDEDCVGRLMHKDFVAAPHFWTVGQAIDHMRRVDDLPDVFFELYLVDKDFRLLGAAPVSSVLRATRDAPLSSLQNTDSSVVFRPESDRESVAYAFQQYNLASAPVVDEDGCLTGMVTIDDMVDVIQEENREDLLALSGVGNGAVSANRTVWDVVRGRAPWLGVNLGTAFMASAVIKMFDHAIEAMVALAILMPVIVALGGNAGAQALAVAVRGIAERELTSATALRAIRVELLASCINGLLFGTCIALITLIWFNNSGLAMVIAVATFSTIVWAATAGVLIPLGLNRIGIDPAVSSSVFVLATVDIVGFLSFLGLAAYWLLG